MHSCPRDDAVKFLAGALTSTEESRFVEHLEDCSDCRELVEEGSGSDQDWQWARELLSISQNPAPASPGTDEPAPEDTGLFPPLVDRSALSFLAPADDPAMIGRVGRYEISGFLGRGSAGIVLKGFDRALNRNVAIKVLDPAIAGSGSARQRFAREARAMAVISHERVVPVYGVDDHAGLPYFVMEYVAGGSLEGRLKREGSLDVVSIVRIALQVAEALAEAHRHGLVHRDIKPANILIDCGTDKVRVADFGLARVANDASCTHSGLIAGTPQYMAPEQIRGETCTAQSDLFSLGGVMYTMCTGHPPFRAESVYAVMQRIVNDPPRPIREQNPLIPAWLEEFILRLLEKDKAERFASAALCAGILDEELASLNNPACARERPRRWSGCQPQRYWGKYRRRVILAGAVVAGTAVALMSAVFLKPPFRGNSLDHENRAPTTAPSVAREPAVTVPLWEADGTRELANALNALESRWHDPSRPIAVDWWVQQTHDLKQRVATLLSEDEPSVASLPARGAAEPPKQ
jgi:eukaryotic-like serine/threonine-protein kinase